MLLHNGNEEKNHHGHGSGFLAAPGAGAVAQSSSDDGPREMDDKTAPASEEIEPFNINIPVFMERTFRMIDSVSDDIVCWSRAGDSFIVKKASKFLDRERERVMWRQDVLSSAASRVSTCRNHQLCYITGYFVYMRRVCVCVCLYF